MVKIQKKMTKKPTKTVGTPPKTLKRTGPKDQITGDKASQHGQVRSKFNEEVREEFNAVLKTFGGLAESLRAVVAAVVALDDRLTIVLGEEDEIPF